MPPRLEVLEDRTLPSLSSLPAVAVASPQAAASFATVMAFEDSVVEQKVQQIAMIVQYADNALNTLGQEIIQEVAALQVQLGRIFGSNPNTQTQSTNAAVSPSGSDGGVGSGGSATATHGSTSQHGGMKMQPMAKSGGGVASTTGGFGGFGSATVSGQVWLDNNGDGLEDDGESGLQGVTVELLDQGNVVGTTTTLPGGNYQFTVNYLKIGLAAGTTSSDPSKVIFDQLQITLGQKKRKPWEFVSGWGDLIDPDKDCKIKRDKDILTIDMPGSDHDYDPVRKKFNAPRLLSELKGRFDLQVRVRIDYRPTVQSTVKDQPSFVSAGFLLIYPEGESFVCGRMEYAVSQQGSRPDSYAVKPRLAEPRRKEPVPNGKEADSYAVMKRWTGALQRKGNTVKWDHGMPEQLGILMWERGWQKWPLPEKAEYAYLRLDHREGWATFFISPDGEKWTQLGTQPHVPANGKLALAAYSASPEPSKVRFDQLKLWREKKQE